jgi:hypothetical protein
MKRCRKCGAPLSIARVRKWNPNGTSTSRFSDAGARFCQLECDELRSILDGLASCVGHPIENLLVECQRKTARSIMDDFLSAAHGLAGSWARTRIVGWPSSARAMNATGVGLGQGRTEMLANEKGSMCRFRIWHPYNVPLLVGDLWGMFEAINSLTAEAVWVEEGDSVTLTLEKVQDDLVWEDPLRLPLKKMPTLGGQVRYDRCARCGVPRDFTRSIEWDMQRGIASNRITGRREVTIVVEALNAAIGELTREAPELVPRALSETEQDYIIGVMGDIALPNTVREYSMLLDEMLVQGMGNPVDVRKEGDALTVRVENPFSEPLLAGKAAGYYQVLERTLPQVTWTPADDGCTVIQAWPA